MVPLCSLHRTYTGICSHDQRQSYKQDFNREYNEYRDLHARIDSVTRQFMGLDTQLKRLHHESHKYKVKHKEIQHFTLCLEQHALTASLQVSISLFFFFFNKNGGFKNKLFQTFSVSPPFSICSSLHFTIHST